MCVLNTFRFNGATRRTAWREIGWVSCAMAPPWLQRSHAANRVESYASGKFPQDKKLLQRSHAANRVESRVERHFPAGLELASTEPRGEPRGEPPPLPIVVERTMLQRSHAANRVERRMWAMTRMPSSMLQRSHAANRVERYGRCIHWGSNPSASTEPRGEPRGESSLASPRFQRRSLQRSHAANRVERKSHLKKFK